MIRFLQLLIFSLFLNDLLAQKLSSCRNNMDCITTFSITEKDCVLSRISSTAMDFASSPNHHKLLDSMHSYHVETPQCYVSKNDHNGKTKPGQLFITCHCAKSFYARCMSTSSMAEAIYQWKKDPESVVENKKETDSEYIGKVDCILKGFQKLQNGTDKNLKKRTPEEYHWKIDCGQRMITKTVFRKLHVHPLPKNIDVAVDIHCDDTAPKELHLRVYCSEDYCYEKSIDVFKNSLISLKSFILIKKSINRGKMIHPAENCKKKSKKDTQCALMGFNQFAQRVVTKSSAIVKSQLTLKQIGENRQKIKANQGQEGASNNHIISWFFFCLYFIPFITMFFVALCSCGTVQRNELGHFLNPNLRDVEQTLLMEMRKNEEIHVSLKKKTSKPKSEIIDVAMTTTSQMGNTDLGSEGPTGPSGVFSSKTMKKDTALKSLEDMKESKDSMGDGAVSNQ